MNPFPVDEVVLRESFLPRRKMVSWRGLAGELRSFWEVCSPHTIEHSLNSSSIMSWWWLFPRVRGFWVNVQQFIPALFFFKVEISSRTLIPLFRPGSVHSGSASGDDCDRVFPDELHVNSLPRYSQPTPTSLGQRFMRVYVYPATCTFGRMTGVF